MPSSVVIVSQTLSYTAILQGMRRYYRDCMCVIVQRWYNGTIQLYNMCVCVCLRLNRIRPYYRICGDTIGNACVCVCVSDSIVYGHTIGYAAIL